MSNVNRKLTSILATDCVGFSSHMEKNEEKTLENLKACRSIIDPYIEEFGGKIFYTAGDSVIADFPSPVSCVNAATNFQKAINERNKNIDEESQFVWRVGIHMDDVIIEGDNIYGSGVNIAARLEAACTPEQILLSSAVKDQVNNKIEGKIEDAGTKSLKNISDSFQTFGISPSGQEVPKTDGNKYAEKAKKDSYKPKLAVMPFTNMNNDEDGGFLVDGIVEDLITEFSRIRELEIVSRQSCFDFRESDQDLDKFCETFGVDYVITGNIRLSGKRARISIELSDFKENKSVWNNKYDRILEDIFDVQDEIVRKISYTLFGEIELSSLQRANRKPTDTLSSYELLLKGKALHHKVEKDALLNALDTFDNAIKADEKNGQAYAWKACALGQGLFRGYIEEDFNVVWKQAQDNLKKARELNENDFEVHRLMSEVTLAMKDYRAAQRHSKLAYDMVPNDPRVLSVYGDVCVRTGKVDEGLDALKLALDLDPIPQGKTNADPRHVDLLFAFYMSRDKEGCLEQIEYLDEIDVRSWLITTKICCDEEHEYESLDWFQEGKKLFAEKEWEKVVPDFRLNNDSASEALIEFGKRLF